MNKDAPISTMPAAQWMLDVETFNYDGYLSHFLTLDDLKLALSTQLSIGWSVAFEVHENDEYGVFLALAGMVPDEETGKAEIWFLPGEDMAKYARRLLKVLPEYIKVFLSLSNTETGITLIDPGNENFKKFAKLCKFAYSSKIEINGMEFEEWEFGG